MSMLKPSASYCLACRLKRKRAYWRRKNARRQGAAIVGRMLTIAELGERDGWRCHLCRRKVDRRLRSPHPRSPTFDHLIPISDGGTDDPANLRLAHRFCNTSRGAGGIVQLMLVG
jgi:5-methylcytosine-specific restriction endonuclease McrA